MLNGRRTAVPRRCPQLGFTIPELAIVLSVLVCLLSALGPYLLQSWEVSRQQICQDRLRSLTSGIIAYHQEAQRYPFGQRALHFSQDSVGRVADPQEARATGDDFQAGESWVVPILPHLGYKDLADAWQEGKSVVANRSVAEKDIADFYCPSRRSSMEAAGSYAACERLADNWTFGGGDYAACTGSGISFSHELRQTYALTEQELTKTLRAGVSPFTSFPTQQGIFGINSAVTQEQVSEADGLSYVILVAERRVSRLSAPSSQQSNDGWAWGGPATLFSTRYAPHTGLDFSEADSEHPGRVHVGMADGRLRVTSWDIDLQTWRNLGNYNQGSPIVHPDFRR